MAAPRLPVTLPEGRALSPREQEVYDDIVAGLMAKDTAARLFISVKTVETYRRNIYLKLGVKGFREVLATAPRGRSHLREE